jgi:hypothetical protein
VNDSPYKFLASYEFDDRQRFFGREIETDVLLADVVVNRLVVLFAKTGTGKTSLINAGVRPVLKERGYASYVIRIRDGDPFQATRELLQAQEGDRFPATGSLAEQLRGLAEALDQPLVLFYDQFEEFFLYLLERDLPRAEEFVDTVAQLYGDAASGVHLVFSMREEWFVEMGFFRERIPAIFHKDSNLRLRWFDRDQARRAIVGPVGNEAYQAALVERLLDDLTASGREVAGTPSPGDIEPAQLQIVCHTLWRERSDGSLTLADYESLGDAAAAASITRQVLDRRLVEGFEAFTAREDLELLDALLPELKTEEGTKRVREYMDIVSALQSAGTSGDLVRVRSVVEKLRDLGLLQLVPRQSGELVELTHDYLVLRLDALRHSIRLIWPRQALRDGLDAYRSTGELLRSDVLPWLLLSVDALGLDAASGELLLRSAIGHQADLAPVLPSVLRSGAPAWEVFDERVREGAPGERLHALEALALFGTPDAYAVLRRALDDPSVAEEVVRLLGRAASTEGVALLAGAIARPQLAAKARIALAELASLPGDSDVKDAAGTALRAAFAGALANPSSAPEAVETLVAIDYPISVDLLEEALQNEAAVTPAREGLVELAASTHVVVAARAREAVLASVETALEHGFSEPWCADVLERIADPAAVELLGRLPYGPPVEEALRRLQASDDESVAATAGRVLERIAKRAPRPESPSTKLLEPRVALGGSGSELDAHYDRVLRLMVNGRLVPLLGAGVGAMGRPFESGSVGSDRPPLAFELAEDLATSASYPPGEPRDLLRIAEYAEAIIGRRWLYEELRSRLAGPFPPTPLHRLLARLPALLRQQGRQNPLPVIATVNVDDSLERALADEGEPFDRLTYIADGPDAGRFLHHDPYGKPTVVANPRSYDRLEPEKRTVILKLLGGIDRAEARGDSFVITEDDVVDFGLHAADPFRFLPIGVLAALADRSYLFLGYSLRDWGVRVLMRALERDSHLSRRSWAVLLGASPVDVIRWRQKDCEVIDEDLAVYVDGLQRHLARFDAGAVPG